MRASAPPPAPRRPSPPRARIEVEFYAPHVAGLEFTMKGCTARAARRALTPSLLSRIAPSKPPRSRSPSPPRTLAGSVSLPALQLAALRQRSRSLTIDGLVTSDLASEFMTDSVLGGE